MQTWDAWGGSWGFAWGYSWGFKEEGGGGSGGKRRKKGWANERAALEQSLRQAQSSLRKTNKPEAVKLAQKINAYEVGGIDLDALRIENAQLQARIQVKEEFQVEMQKAQEIIQAYIEDEQEAIDTLILSLEMDMDMLR
jgi:uncharacterized tellurite resistance protein B-like protein